MTSNAFDVQKVRKDFPILSTQARGMPLIYMDHAATSQKPKAVIEAIVDYYQNTNANAHRGVHYLSEKATGEFEAARDTVSRFIGAARPEEIIFVRGATEAFNLVASAYGGVHISAGDVILVTRMEHHANFVPWQMLAREKGARFEIVELTREGRIDSDDFARKLKLKPKIFAVSLMSNMLGTINPVARMAAQAKAAGCECVVVDAAQAIAHFPVKVSSLGPIDFLAFSGHKILAPTGIGVLWGRMSVLEKMRPYHTGGHMIAKVEDQTCTFGELPSRFEAGTAHIEGVLGLGAAICYLESLPFSAASQYEEDLGKNTLAKLRKIEGLTLYGPQEWQGRGAVFGFTLEGVHTQDLAQFLDLEGIAVRSGHMCLQPLLRFYGIESVIRVSLSFTNTEEEVDSLINGIKKAQSYFEKLKARENTREITGKNIRGHLK